MANPFTSSKSDIVFPDIEQSQLDRQRKTAELLRQQGLTPLEGQMISGIYVKPRWTQALAKGVQAFLGSKDLGYLDEQEKSLNARRLADTANTLKQYNTLLKGSPEQQLEDRSPTVGNNPAAPNMRTIPAVAPNPEAANDLLMSSQNPWIQQLNIKNLAAQLEPSKFSGKINYDQSGKAYMTDERGNVKFLPNISERTKYELKDLGGQLVPFDPYNPTGPLNKTYSPAEQVAIRGQNMTDVRDRAIAGIDSSGLPTGDIEAIVDAIGTGRMAPLSSFSLSKPRGQMIMAKIAEKYPEYDATDYQTKLKATKDFGSGKQGNEIRSFNAAMSHLDTLDQLGNALNNGNIPMFNQIANQFSKQTGQPAPTNFESAKKLIGDEIAKAIAGTSTALADRQEIARAFSSASSPQQLSGAIKTAQDLMGGKLIALKQQYEQATGRKNFNDKVGPAGIKYIEGAAKKDTASDQKKTPDIKFLGFEVK